MSDLNRDPEDEKARDFFILLALLTAGFVAVLGVVLLATRLWGG